MPNTGRPSGACQACRRMKVKCGEERPGCIRCIRANRPCPGYATDIDNFRYANPARQGKLAWSRRPLKAESFQDSSGSQSAATSRNADLDAKSLEAVHIPTERYYSAISPAIETDWEQHALKYFFYFHTIPLRSGSVYGGYMTLLEDFCQNAGRRPYLEDALNAVALASISHLTDLSWLPAKARAYRAKALTSLLQVLGSDTEARSDETLMALFLLERFEASLDLPFASLLMSGDNQTKKVWFNHSKGLSALLHLRGQSQFESEMGLELFQSINSQLLLKDFGYGTSLAHPQPRSYFPLSRPGSYQTIVMHRLANLLRQFRQTLDITSMTVRDAASLQAVWKNGIELEQDFQRWLKYPHPRLAVLAKSSITLFHNSVNYFPNVFDGVVWIRYWTLRIRILRLLLDCTTRLQTPVDPNNSLTTETGLLAAITECGDAICDTVPFLIGEVDTEGNLRPQGSLHLQGAFFGCMNILGSINVLITTEELEYTRPGMRAWAFGRLLELGNRAGLKQAHAFHRFYRARIEANFNIKYHSILGMDDPVSTAVATTGVDVLSD